MTFHRLQIRRNPPLGRAIAGRCSSGKKTQATGIYFQRLINSEFHAEIGYCLFVFRIKSIWVFDIFFHRVSITKRQRYVDQACPPNWCTLVPPIGLLITLADLSSPLKLTWLLSHALSSENIGMLYFFETARINSKSYLHVQAFMLIIVIWKL